MFGWSSSTVPNIFDESDPFFSSTLMEPSLVRMLLVGEDAAEGCCLTTVGPVSSVFDSD